MHILLGMHAPGLSIQACRSLGRALRNAPALPGRTIGAQLRELIILHVSSINGCPVCSATHALVARRVGVAREDVRAARECVPPGFEERARVALRYAELRTLDHEADHIEELERFQHTFSPVEQREIRAIVDLFTFNNRFNNTWERYIPGASRRRERMGLCETPPA